MVSGQGARANQALEPTALNRADTLRGVWPPRLSAGCWRLLGQENR